MALVLKVLSNARWFCFFLFFYPESGLSCRLVSGLSVFVELDFSTASPDPIQWRDIGVEFRGASIQAFFKFYGQMFKHYCRL